MSLYGEIISLRLDGFSILYVQVGQIELALRRLVPLTLSSFTCSSEAGRWFSILEFDIESRKSLEKARRFSTLGDGNLEDYLPLSFWTRLFALHNHEKLWIPYVHRCFPNLKNPKSLRSSREIYFLMNELRRVRNHVAHYNFAIYGNLVRDRKNLARLQFLLGLSD